MTPLCDIAYKYGTDKCPQIQHFYTPFYYELFKDKRNSVKKVLEMGIGSPQCMKQFYEDYIMGASLYMWREFFPNAQIYGADIDSQTIFEDERIKTFLCDELNKDDLISLIEKTGSDIDLFVDDGTHYVHEQVFLCQNIMPLLKKDVIYVIEDVRSSKVLTRLLRRYDCYVPDLHAKKKIYRDTLVVVKNK